MPEFDYVGVRPCGCITAWLSSDNVSQAEVRDFYRSMADTGREVRRMTLAGARSMGEAFLPTECSHGNALRHEGEPAGIVCTDPSKRHLITRVCIRPVSPAEVDTTKSKPPSASAPSNQPERNTGDALIEKALSGAAARGYGRFGREGVEAVLIAAGVNEAGERIRTVLNGDADPERPVESAA